jgi:uncharacterized protein YciI
MKYLLLLVFMSITLSVLAQSKSYTVVFLNKKADSEKISEEATKQLMEGHMANINRLAKEGKLLAAGPFEGGGGLFILNTTSIDEAESWVSTDPAVKAQRWDLEILPYTPRTGSICPVTEPYEMVMYTLVRFDAIVEKVTASSYPMLIRRHDEFMTKHIDRKIIVTEAIFGENEGGILVVKGDLPADIFAADPGVQQGLLHVNLKKLYIAKTSFCEE